MSQSELNVVELLFDAPGEGEIEIVTAEQKVLAYGGALKLMLAINQTDTDQAEVGRAAADVADQNQIAIAEVFALSRLCVSIRRVSILRNPGIKRRQRFFEQGEFIEPGAAGRFNRQLTRILIERSGNGEDNFLILKTRLRCRCPLRRSMRRADA